MNRFVKLFLPMMIILIFSSCFSGIDTDPQNLDSDLFGTWVFTDEDQMVTASWTFNDDGSCVQFLYGTDYDWEWEIEGDQLKLFVEGGTPGYKIYVIEGNLLYFWVDSIDDWGLAFTKQ